MYSDILYDAVSEAARRALRAMNPTRYEYKTEFARRYYGQGLTEGEAKGRAELVLRQLSLRFGRVPEAVAVSLRGASIDDLDRIGERLLSASSLDEVLEAR